MEQPRCALCDQSAGEDAQRIPMRPEDRAWLEDDLRRRGHDATRIVESVVEQAVLCAQCAALPKAERRKLVPEMWARVRRRFGLPAANLDVTEATASKLGW